MGRKTRILRKLNKFGLKYFDHPILKNKTEEAALIFSLKEELPLPIKEEILEPIVEPVIVDEVVEVKTPTPPKKVAKPKK